MRPTRPMSPDHFAVIRHLIYIDHPSPLTSSLGAPAYTTPDATTDHLQSASTTRHTCRSAWLRLAIRHLPTPQRDLLPQVDKATPLRYCTPNTDPRRKPTLRSVPYPPLFLTSRLSRTDQATGFVHTPATSAPGSTPDQPPTQTTRTQGTGTAPAKLAHRTQQRPGPKAATGTDAQTTSTFLRALSYPHLPTAPHVYRMFHRCNIGRLIIAITRWSILGDDLRDRHTPPLLDVQGEHEAVPVVKAIGPTLHVCIAAPLLVNARTICYTPLIAGRVRFPRLSRCAKIRLVPEEGQRIHRVTAILHSLMGDHIP